MLEISKSLNDFKWKMNFEIKMREDGKSAI